MEDVLRAQAEVLGQELVTTSRIEGQDVDLEAVRSSVAMRLGLPEGGLTRDRYVEGLVEVLLDATTHFDQPLTPERLYGWQAGLFPTGYSSIHRINLGAWRDCPMQVVSGAHGKEVVHYLAPPAEQVEPEMARFLAWWEESRGRMDGLLRGGMSVLWFLTIPPFADGNGRIARALTDMALTQDDDLPRRYFSMSSSILKERDGYYEILSATQRGGGDIMD